MRIMRFQFAQITYITDMIALPILVDILVLRLLTTESCDLLESLQD